VGDHDAGVASALVNTTQQIGGSLGTALLNTVATGATAAFIAANGATQVRAGLVHGYTTAFVVSGVLMLFAALVAWVLVSPGKPEAHVAYELDDDLGDDLDDLDLETAGEPA
jgi:sugar phosphate permease